MEDGTKRLKPKGTKETEAQAGRAQQSKATQLKQNLGETVYLMRKTARISQVQLGNLLSLHQTAICRIEQGFQSLLIEQLDAISQFFDVKVDQLIHGEVDYEKIAQKFNGHLPLPSRYSQFPYSKVREVLPSLRFLERVKGRDEVSQLLSSFEIPTGFFLNPDATMGAYLHLDVLRHLVQSGDLNQETLPMLVSEARSSQVQGFLHPIYETQINSFHLLQTLLLNSHHYHTNFAYHLSDIGPKSGRNTMTVAVVPQAHMEDVSYQDDFLGDVLCQYKKAYLTHFAKYAGSSRPAKCIKKNCHFNGAASMLLSISKTFYSQKVTRIGS